MVLCTSCWVSSLFLQILRDSVTLILDAEHRDIKTHYKKVKCDTPDTKYSYKDFYFCIITLQNDFKSEKH